MHTRKKGQIAEQVAKQYYEQRGYTCAFQNFTIRGGELDLVMENATRVVCVEVKDITMVSDIHDYITPVKRRRIMHAFQTYLWKFPTQKDIICEVVFISHGKVATVIDNCIDFS